MKWRPGGGLPTVPGRRPQGGVGAAALTPPVAQVRRVRADLHLHRLQEVPRTQSHTALPGAEENHGVSLVGEMSESVVVSVGVSLGLFSRFRGAGAKCFFSIGTPGRIRTCGLLLRRQTLYPAELRARLSTIIVEKGREGKFWPYSRKHGGRKGNPFRTC